MRTRVAMVVTWELPWTTPTIREWKARMSTPTPPWTATATTTHHRSLLDPSQEPTLPPTTLLPSRPPSLLAPSQSPLRLTPSSSSSTLVVSSTPRPAEPTSTTVLSLSDTVLTHPRESTTLSETHGAHHGELGDTSTSPLLMELVSAVSRWSQSTPTSERRSHHHHLSPCV